MILHTFAKLLLKWMILELSIIGSNGESRLWTLVPATKRRVYLGWNSKLPKVQEPEALLTF